MTIVSRGDWNYDLSVSETGVKDRFTWVIVRFPKNMTVAVGTPLASGEAESREMAEQKAEGTLQNILREGKGGS